MYVEKDGLESIRDGARRTLAAIENLHAQHVVATADLADPRHKATFTAKHIASEQAALRDRYLANLRQAVESTNPARENLAKAAAERSPGALLKAALAPTPSSKPEETIARELRTARLRHDAQIALAAALPTMVDEAAAARDLHHLALLHREVETRAWPLTDPARISAKVALSRALDNIDELVPGRAAEIGTIQTAAEHFHCADEFLRAARLGVEPLPLAMKRSAERIAAQAGSAPQQGGGRMHPVVDSPAAAVTSIPNG